MHDLFSIKVGDFVSLRERDGCSLVLVVNKTDVTITVDHNGIERNFYIEDRKEIGHMSYIHYSIKYMPPEIRLKNDFYVYHINKILEERKYSISTDILQSFLNTLSK